jgi:putative ABC transport system permease protein
MTLFDQDRWQEIRNALASNKMRTFLTSGTGLENGATFNFRDGATNSFFVWTRATSKPYKGLPAGRRFEFNNNDTIALRQQVPEVAVVAPRNQLGGFRSGNTVSHGNESGSFNVMGDYPEIRVIQSVRMDSGRFLNQLDLKERRKVAVIGSRIHEELFEPNEDPIGQHIRINGVYFKVVGLHRPILSGNQGDRDAQTIYIPFTTFQTALNYGDEVGWFAITSRSDVPASVAEEKVMAMLKQQHRVDPTDARALGHFNLEEEFTRVQSLFNGIRALVWIVGIGTLAAGVIGVSNIMLVIVRERTNEIGIRRAIGATPASIRLEIVIEAIVLTSLAGYLGLMAGVVLVDVVATLLKNSDSSMFMNPSVSLGSAVQALLILIVSGTLAGLIPAQRAVAISPVQALRS